MSRARCFGVFWVKQITKIVSNCISVVPYAMVYVSLSSFACKIEKKKGNKCYCYLNFS